MPKLPEYPLFEVTLDRIQHFDFKQHWQDWHRHVLPIFVIVAALAMVVLMISRIGNRTMTELYDPEAVEARVGLIRPGADAIFDPAFAVPSPLEMARAPTATTFAYPVGSEHGALTYNAQPFLENQHLGDDLNGIGGWNSDLGDPVYAIADGEVIYAGWPSAGWGNVVILIHQRADGQLTQSLYSHLDTIKVPVGETLRKGQLLGTMGNADGKYLAHLHFEIRRYPSLDVGAGYGESELGRVATEPFLRHQRNRPNDQLSAPVAGEALPPRSLQVEPDTTPVP
ncbi:MAG: M23 family metallopeptidase [Verrucomicrobiota bacterium]